MRFELRHTFDAPVGDVLDAMYDPELHDYLRRHMKRIQDIRPMERTVDGQTIRRRVRYVPAPILRSVGPKQVPPDALAFIEESTCDRAALRITFRNVGEHEGVRRHLENRGTITFREVDGRRTERTIAGELRITNLPFLLRPLGRLAERVIYPSAEQLLDEEAQVFGDFLRLRGKPAA